MESLNYDKLGGLVPAVIQDVRTNQVLMVGFMNPEALQKTIAERKVTFWSRTKKRLWQKGETSGNYLEYVSMQTDCDDDSLLIKAIPHGPVCHTNQFTCFGEDETSDVSALLGRLEETIHSRKQMMPEGSYHMGIQFREEKRVITASFLSMELLNSPFCIPSSMMVLKRLM